MKFIVFENLRVILLSNFLEITKIKIICYSSLVIGKNGPICNIHYTLTPAGILPKPGHEAQGAVELNPFVVLSL